MRPREVLLDPRMPVASEETVTAGRAMMVGPFQLEWSENAVEGLRPPASEARHATAGSDVMRLCGVAVIGVKPLLNGAGSQAERMPPDRRFQGFRSRFQRI